MTQLNKARQGKTTPEMRKVAKNEKIKVDKLRGEIAKGRVVIPANIKHKNLDPIGIGRILSTKINANLGSSPRKAVLKDELGKLKVSLKYGADTVMDLSIGGDIDKIRRTIIKRSPVPVGTVPIYQAVCEKNKIENLSEDDFLAGIEKHVKDGVDFITIHAGLTKSCIPLLTRRLAGVVSRGGSILVRWMKHNNKENPLYTNFDEILDLAAEYDVTLSLGDGLRPGCLKDATDKAQIAELKTLGKLTKLAWKKDVQVMIEGPGHVPLDQIQKNMELQKKYCHNAPFYVLGPLVTDVAPGYDHITSAIGGTLAAYYGASFLCYVTPAEHLRLPELDDVREGVIASRIAAHAADVARGLPGARDWDDKMSKFRVDLDWEGMINTAIDSDKARLYRKQSKIKNNVCTMCGDLCAVKTFKEK
ncbi:MAG: phosphomethylpyrimidine synthase ThiC [Candidatus Altiarchaeota archaeon]